MTVVIGMPCPRVLDGERSKRSAKGRVAEMIDHRYMKINFVDSSRTLGRLSLDLGLYDRGSVTARPVR
jgi:hypothetical protein